LRQKPISILCVDDNPLVGDSLARWFARITDFRFAGYVQDGRKVEQVVHQLHPDVVLMDLDMPGIDTVALVARLAASKPTIHVAMLSAHADPGDIRRCLDAGACGYLCKDENPVAVAVAVHEIAEGKRVLSPVAQAALDAGPLHVPAAG
jgi:DNA-binding NarL/FixJ family response regulator